MTARPHDAAEQEHDHGGQGGHSHASGAPARALLIALILTTSFIAAEVIGGVVFNSLALLADAGHMVSDAAALGLALVAIWMAARPHSSRRTFGWHRMEVLAAAINGVALIAIGVYIIYEGIQRFQAPEAISSGGMFLVAIIGLVVNLVSLTILMRSGGEGLNVRGAIWHVAGDALGSVGVLVAAAIIFFTGWVQADAVVSIFISVLILIAGWRITREAGSVLLESSPAGVDVDQVERDLQAIPGVVRVHDLHVWTVTSGFVSLSAHAEIAGDADSDAVLRQANDLLHDRYEIRHVTIQPERTAVHGDDQCCLDEHKATPAGASTVSREG